MSWQRASWILAVAFLVAACTPSSLPATIAEPAPVVSTTTVAPTTTVSTTTSTAAPDGDVGRVTLAGVVDFGSRESVEWGGAVPGCSLTGEWADLIYEGAVVQIHDRDANLLGEGVLGSGETKADIHCHFPYEVEVPNDADWYSMCLLTIGPSAPTSRADLVNVGWKINVAQGCNPSPEPTPCDTFLGDSFGPLDDAGKPPAIDAEDERAEVRAHWEQIRLDGYTIEYSRSSPSESGSESAGNGDYHIVMTDRTITSCRFTPSSDTRQPDPCELLLGTQLSPVDHFFELIEAYGRKHVAVAFDIELPVPVLIRYDRPDTAGEEFTIRVTWFRGDW